MASWHVFMQGRWQAFLLNRAGAFSIYREGIDRAAVNTAVDILESAERPLVIFSRGDHEPHQRCDQRSAGWHCPDRPDRRQAPGQDRPNQKVVIHPIAIRYRFIGDITAEANKVLDQIETRLTWARQPLPLRERIHKAGGALLALKELEYLGQADNGPVAPAVGKARQFDSRPARRSMAAPTAHRLGPRAGEAVAHRNPAGHDQG